MNCSYCQNLLPDDNLCTFHTNSVRFIYGPKGEILETQIYLTATLPHRYIALSYYVDEFSVYKFDPMMQLVYYLDHIPDGITPDNAEQFIQRLLDLKVFL